MVGVRVLADMESMVRAGRGSLGQMRRAAKSGPSITAQLAAARVRRHVRATVDPIPGRSRVDTCVIRTSVRKFEAAVGAGSDGVPTDASTGAGGSRGSRNSTSAIKPQAADMLRRCR